jgi:formylglycine-generating enzyme required for sulfatase activity/flavodoxin
MSFWSFVLMGLHLGLHLPAMTAQVKLGKWVKTALTCAFTCAAGVGLGQLLRNGIPDYLFFRTPFAFFDYDKPGALVFLENLAELFFFAFVGANVVRLTRSLGGKKERKASPLIPVLCVALALLVGIGMILLNSVEPSGAGRDVPQQTEAAYSTPEAVRSGADKPTGNAASALEPKDPAAVADGFALIAGGSFLMGSPESENWRIEDETLHVVTVSSFYIDPYETTQAEYARVMGENPSAFSGNDLPVERITWLDAVLFANAKSADAGLTPAYMVSDADVLWDRSANGYRLPTEAEWEYACRAGTETPFNTERSLDANDANFYGHYPYEIEENYFNDSVLEARPGQYRQTTVAVGSFYESRWGLYDMHGNVNEWCWDYYGAYDLENNVDPVGAESGTRHVYRGGGWNDFGKNMRSAYRAAGQSDLRSANLGVRLVRNADNGVQQTVMVAETARWEKTDGKLLIAFFSWGGNTRGIAQEIQRQTGADLYEITPVHPYSTSYNTVLMEAQEDQHNQARPELADPPESIDEYDVILLGYPNWWASIPMPIASFLELYDFSGKTIIPFCSHGGGRFGQSLTAIAKLAPDSVMGEGLSVHYSGGASLPGDVSAWLDENGIARK